MVADIGTSQTPEAADEIQQDYLRRKEAAYAAMERWLDLLKERPLSVIHESRRYQSPRAATHPPAEPQPEAAFPLVERNIGWIVAGREPACEINRSRNGDNSVFEPRRPAGQGTVPKG
jgi:hypothetical protein